eukprot:3802504-Rhodomonas_salina.1
MPVGFAIRLRTRKAHHLVLLSPLHAPSPSTSARACRSGPRMMSASITDNLRDSSSRGGRGGRGAQGQGEGRRRRERGGGGGGGGEYGTWSEMRQPAQESMKEPFTRAESPSWCGLSSITSLTTSATAPAAAVIPPATVQSVFQAAEDTCSAAAAAAPAVVLHVSEDAHASPALAVNCCPAAAAASTADCESAAALLHV